MKRQNPPERPTPFSRRDFLRGGALVSLGAAAAPAVARELEAEGQEPDGQHVRGRHKIQLRINGQAREVQVEPRTSLLEALRVHLSPPMTGTKLVCDGGNCGACTVLLDGEPVASCMVLAVDAAGHQVRTIEGEGDATNMSPMQAAFCEYDGMMCGFCTSGFIMSLTAAVEADPKATEQQLREACAGNLCRCGTYPQVFESALAAMRGSR